MKITFPDGSKKDFEKGTTGISVAMSISEGLARNSVALIWNSKTLDITAEIPGDGTIKILTFKDKEGVGILRHSTAHIMAYAVTRLFPGVKLAIGPVIEDGFYYDFDMAELKNSDFDKIEAEMKKIVAEKIPFERIVLPRKEALKVFKDEPYKIELINELPENEEISAYRLGNFTDLCRGPHLPNSGMAGSFKLLRIAGAYWRGDSKNKMLTRVYATGFPNSKELNAYLEMRKVAEENDHNKIGRELDLFITDKDIGQGLPLLTPKGAVIKQVLQRFIEDEEFKRGYNITATPFMAKSDLFKISGHWDHYRDGMFIFKGDEKAGEDENLYALRPMTCPFQFKLYNRKKHSYRELPVRYAETSTLFRNESSGEMHGLIRVRQFTLSDAHIICLPEQVEDEFLGALELVRYIMDTLDLKDNITYRFSKWDPKNRDKYIDNPEAWEKSQDVLKKILDRTGLSYYVADGEAAFYGPKLDIQFKNVWGKEDTIITLQIDFALPGRFNMKYTDRDGSEKTPMVVHRSSIGCYERTMASLIERFAGKFPFWISPEQVRILTINDSLSEYAHTIRNKLMERFIRAEVDDTSETLNKKVLTAQKDYIPAIITVGNKERDAGTISVRTLDGKVKFGMTADDFIGKCVELCSNRSKETVF